jgi:chorismate mutase
MSPKNKKELILIRKKLDSLDNKLIELIKKRTKLVDKVVQLKVFKKEIVDKKRISNILKGVKQKSIRKNIDPKITHRIWKNMIWSYINYEKKIFKKK